MENTDDNLYDNTNLPGEDIVQGEIPLSPSEQGQLEALGTIEEEIIPEQIPEELQVADPLELIPIAIANNKMLQIMYTNKKNETKLYVIEPYEIGGNHSHPAGYLWAFDRNAGTIKSFYLSGLMDIQMLDEIFIPRG